MIGEIPSGHEEPVNINNLDTYLNSTDVGKYFKGEPFPTNRTLREPKLLEKPFPHEHMDLMKKADELLRDQDKQVLFFDDEDLRLKLGVEPEVSLYKHNNRTYIVMKSYLDQEPNQAAFMRQDEIILDDKGEKLIERFFDKKYRELTHLDEEGDENIRVTVASILNHLTPVEDKK